MTRLVIPDSIFKQLNAFRLMLGGRHTAAISRRENARVLPATTLDREGAGNAGRLMHPQSRVQKIKSTRA
jgi:hypothetical protein